MISSYVRNGVGYCTLVHGRYLKVQYRQRLLAALLIATILTLIFLPTLHVTWFRGKQLPAWA
jgi:hypothetical protein